MGLVDGFFLFSFSNKKRQVGKKGYGILRVLMIEGLVRDQET